MLLPERRNEALITYIEAIPLKPIELPPAVARRFVEDMRAFHVEPNAIKRDEIASRQLHALKQHYAGKLRLRLAAMFPEKPDDPLFILQPRHKDVEVHPVDPSRVSLTWWLTISATLCAIITPAPVVQVLPLEGV